MPFIVTKHHRSTRERRLKNDYEKHIFEGRNNNWKVKFEIVSAIVCFGCAGVRVGRGEEEELSNSSVKNKFYVISIFHTCWKSCEAVFPIMEN